MKPRKIFLDEHDRIQRRHVRASAALLIILASLSFGLLAVHAAQAITSRPVGVQEGSRS